MASNNTVCEEFEAYKRMTDENAAQTVLMRAEIEKLKAERTIMTTEDFAQLLRLGLSWLCAPRSSGPAHDKQS
ncbi:hypothetical protein CHLRE_05g242850v5 [Chlamydomonas reinhardtii]|uniref:Uncharacterized protein n=1 Tax=Chlamydomonas reinhardtii TaxID=3055 RepID=A0A2K3DSD9_CHLRE|nr:uncharacterized protein CHLRE_05g242850v5 [Chlamydomonas reinhardtii]PNW83450.1 hypothetical protein CHLRE_05g242850v5 [Chlamydomonas reinhardtii]